MDLGRIKKKLEEGLQGAKSFVGTIFNPTQAIQNVNQGIRNVLNTYQQPKPIQQPSITQQAQQTFKAFAQPTISSFNQSKQPFQLNLPKIDIQKGLRTLQPYAESFIKSGPLGIVQPAGEITKAQVEAEPDKYKNYVQTAQTGPGSQFYAPKAKSTAQQAGDLTSAAVFYGTLGTGGLAKAATTPVAKVGLAMGEEAVQNVVSGAATRYGETGDIKQAFDPKSLAIDAGIGAAFAGTISAPGQIAKSVRGARALDAVTNQIKVQNTAKGVLDTINKSALNTATKRQLQMNFDNFGTQRAAAQTVPGIPVSKAAQAGPTPAVRPQRIAQEVPSKIVYHGTNANIKSLADLKAGKTLGPGGTNLIYVSESPTIAKGFGKNLIKGKIYGKDLNVRNTFGNKYGDVIIPPEFADYKTKLNPQAAKVFENTYGTGYVQNYVVDIRKDINKYLTDKGYSTVTTHRTTAVPKGEAQTETILINPKAIDKPTVTTPKAIDKPTVTTRAGQQVLPTRFAQAEGTPGRLQGEVDLTPKKGVITKLKTGIYESDAPVISRLKAVEKQTGKTGVIDRFFINTGLVTRSNAAANQFMRENVNLNNALKGLTKRQLKDLNDYAQARAELSNASKGMQTSRPVNVLRDTVNRLDAQYNQRFQAFNNFYKDLATVAYRANKIDDATYRRFLADDNYIRIQRNMDDLVGVTPQGKGKGISSGISFMTQKRKGSAREILPSDITAFEATQRVFREATKNKAVSDLIDDLAPQGVIRNLVNAQDVEFRRDVWSFLKDTKPVKDFIAREFKASKKELRIIQSELNKLNKEGLNISLRTEQPSMQGITPQLLKELNTRDIRGVIKSLIVDEPARLRQVRDMIARRDPKASALIDRVIALQDELEGVTQARGRAYQAALGRADMRTANKNTIRRTVNGVVEVWEVPADVKEVVDKIQPFQLSILERIIAFPKRIIQASTTGLNLPFAISNYLVDQAGSAINSKNVLATHNPKLIMSGLYSAGRGFLGTKNDPLWNDFLSYSGDVTQFDLLRNAPEAKALSRELRRGRAGEIANAVRSPIRTAEDFISITEKATRFQNFKGTYNALKKANPDLPNEEILRRAALAAWQNSVDFNRFGNWGRILNLIIPYFNSSVQGSRTLVRSFAKRPAQTTFKTMAFVGMPLIGVTAWNLSDPKRKAIYDNIPDYEKQSNLIIIPPEGTEQNDDGTYNIMKIPMPFGYRNLVSPIRRYMESYSSEKPVEFDAIATDIIGAISGPIDPTSPERTASALMPAVAKPSVQQMLNRDLYTGKPIVPDYIEQATTPTGEPVKEGLKAYKTTSGSSSIIGRFLNVSPIRVDKFLKDTFGRSYNYVQYGADNLLKEAGLIEEQRIGGVSPVKDLAKRFLVAQSIENYKKSEGAKYFDKIEEITKGFTAEEKRNFEMLNPVKKNFLGEDIYQGSKLYNPEKKLVAYNDTPKVFEAEKKLNDYEKSLGQLGDPLFELTKEQAQLVLLKQALKPGQSDPQLDKLWQQEWYVDYKDANKRRFDQLKFNAAMKGKPFDSPDNQYPQTAPQLQTAMDTYSKLPKGTGARSNWIRNNPQLFQAMKDQWARVDDWENKERAKYGLAATEGAAGIAAGFKEEQKTTSRRRSYTPRTYSPLISSRFQRPGGLSRVPGIGPQIQLRPGRVVVKRSQA